MMFLLSSRAYLAQYSEKQKPVKKIKASMQKEKMYGKALSVLLLSSRPRTFPARLRMELIREAIMTVDMMSNRSKMILI